VPQLLLARWTGEAAASEHLLAAFHRRLQAGDAPVVALRAAQQAVRGRVGGTAPHNWAGWLLISGR
jgi:CHAT domain-containing protein